MTGAQPHAPDHFASNGEFIRQQRAGLAEPQRIHARLLAGANAFRAE